ncbi:MAG: regulatory protein RecX [Bacteroidales bacterium]
MDDEQYQQILNSVKSLCAKSEKCAGDIYKKNKKWQLPGNKLEEMIETLKEEGFIDHKRYTHAFVNDKLRFNHWGKNKIKYSLINKQIDEQFIDEALEAIDEQLYSQILKKETDKKLKSLRDQDKYDIKNKTAQYLVQKGFEYGKVFEFIEKRMRNNDY